jgi:hypothetical protein
VVCLVSGATPTLRRYSRTGCYGRLIVPTSGDWPLRGMVWACDNSAFNGFEPDRFIRMLERLRDHPGCLWVSSPDVVANAEATLLNFEEWEPVLRVNYGRPVALVAQDGLELDAVPWDRLQALFIGGTTEWKLGPDARELATEAKARGKWLHVGRVGTKKRIRYCQAIGADSIDGGVFSTHPEQGFGNFTALLLNPEPNLEAALA